MQMSSFSRGNGDLFDFQRPVNILRLSPQAGEPHGHGGGPGFANSAVSFPRPQLCQSVCTLLGLGKRGAENGKTGPPTMQAEASGQISRMISGLGLGLFDTALCSPVSQVHMIAVCQRTGNPLSM